MLVHLIRKEILDQILSLRFLILSMVGAFAVWLSLYAGYTYYRNCLKDYRLAKAVTEERVRRLISRKDWTEIYTTGFQEHKPPTPMSIFIRGLEPNLPRSILIASPLRVRRMIRSPEGMEPILGIFRSLDLGMVVQTVLSLFVLLFTYDAVCGEKEGGTLRLIASFPVPRDRLLLGKLIGSLLPILTAFAIPSLLGIAVVLALPEVNLKGPELLRLTLILLAFALYLTAFACAGLLASCLAHRAATSFVLLLAFWVTSVVVVPRLSLMVAEGVRPVPSKADVEAQKKAFENVEVQKWMDRLTDWRNKQGTSDRQWSPETQEAYENYKYKIFWETREVIESYWERLDEGFRNRYNARLDLAVLMARLSPAFALSHATVRLAGAGVERHRRFQASFDAYVKKFHYWRHSKNHVESLQQAQPARYGKFERDFSDMPRFTYQETWEEEDVRTALMDLGVLCLWGLIFFVGAYVAMLRYDLR